MNKIAVIAPYKELANIFEELRNTINYEFEIIESVCDEAIPIVKNLIKNKCKIIISRGETATMIKNSININETYLLEIPITDCDRLSMISKALDYGNKIAIVGFSATMYSSKFINRIINKDVVIKYYKMTKASEINDICRKVTEDGFRIIAGTPKAVCRAQEYNAIGIPLKTEFSTAKSVLTDAIKLLNIFETRERNTKNINNIYNVNSIIFDFNNNIISDTIILNKDLKNKLISSLKYSNKNKSSYGMIETTTEKLYYIINYIENIEKNIYSCCYIAKENKFINIQNKYTFKNFVTKSAKLNKTIEFMKGVAQSNSTIIIYGETGTGKSMLASAIHAESPRNKQPFISFNCATIPETLIESELFGYYAGAFTGAARKGKKGYFELADGGTIFLDEINELSQSAQTKILKFIEEKTFIPIGSEESISVDVRIICATNKSLQDLIIQKKFRKDLYYRLNIFEFMIPPLRERIEDIIPIAAIFINYFNKKLHCDFQLNDSLINKLQSYYYEGNIRQLRTIIERLVTLYKLNMSYDFAFKNFTNTNDNEYDNYISQGKILSLEELEKKYIDNILKYTGYNKDKAAKLLGISKTTLWRKYQNNMKD